MLKVGDGVYCRFFNIPDRKFYGETIRGKIIRIEQREQRIGSPQKWYQIEYQSKLLMRTDWFLKKEIQKR